MPALPCLPLPCLPSTTPLRPRTLPRRPPVPVTSLRIPAGRSRRRASEVSDSLAAPAGVGSLPHQMLTSPTPMPTHVPVSLPLPLVTSSWLSSLPRPPSVAQRLVVVPRPTFSNARNVPFLLRPERKLSESVFKSTSLQIKNNSIQAARLPAPGTIPLPPPLPSHPFPSALQDLLRSFLWTRSLAQVFAPLPTTILPPMTTMTTKPGENQSLMRSADELGNTPSVSLFDHSRVCVFAVIYLYRTLLPRKAPTFLPARIVSLVRPLSLEEAYFLMGIPLSIHRFSFSPSLASEFLVFLPLFSRFASFFCDLRQSNFNFCVCVCVCVCVRVCVIKTYVKKIPR